MRLVVLLVAAACVLAAAPARSETTKNCTSLQIVDVSPKGGISERNPWIRVWLEWTGDECGLGELNFWVDDQPVKNSGYGWTPGVNRYEAGIQPWTPLEPGQHTVRAYFMANDCCNSLGQRNTAETTWTVLVTDNAQPARQASYDTPGQYVLEQCTLLACVGPFPVPLPSVGATVRVENTYVWSFGDPAYVGTAGPIQQEVPTPFGPLPLTLCPQTCPKPEYAESTIVGSGAYVELRVLGQKHSAGGPVTETL